MTCSEDDLLKLVGEAIKNDVDGAVLLPDMQRMQAVANACETLEEIIREYSPDAKIKISLDEMTHRHMGFSAAASSFDLENIEALCGALSVANAIEIFAKRNGDSEIVITFRDCFVKIGSQK